MLVSKLWDELGTPDGEASLLPVVPNKEGEVEAAGTEAAAVEEEPEVEEDPNKEVPSPVAAKEEDPNKEVPSPVVAREEEPNKEPPGPVDADATAGVVEEEVKAVSVTAGVVDAAVDAVVDATVDAAVDAAVGAAVDAENSVVPDPNKEEPNPVLLERVVEAAVEAPVPAVVPPRAPKSEDPGLGAEGAAVVATEEPNKEVPCPAGAVPEFPKLPPRSETPVEAEDEAEPVAPNRDAPPVEDADESPVPDPKLNREAPFPAPPKLRPVPAAEGPLAPIAVPPDDPNPPRPLFVRFEAEVPAEEDDPKRDPGPKLVFVEVPKSEEAPVALLLPPTEMPPAPPNRLLVG
ncbi:hypothetical protein HWI79_1969 [Cryptosporidium felis]|nr:hypothetical protein HWI79_1969 [Cryptosporidium felis]